MEREIDLKGLRCPREILELMKRSREFQEGDVITVYSDCETFERDLKKFVEKLNKKLVSLEKVDEKTYKAVIEW